VTLADVERLVASITYKPGWRIWTERPPAEQLVKNRWAFRNEEAGLKFHITAQVPDAYRPGAQIQVKQSRLISGYDLLDMPEEMLIEVLYGMIRDAEQHETEEFFQINGKRPFDPHG
jgi:hypothetical protein